MKMPDKTPVTNDFSFFDKLMLPLNICQLIQYFQL